MKVLVMGSGGREHAICWKLKQSEKVEKVFCVPGNAGIALDAECPDIPADDFNAVSDFALGNGIELVVIGPEAPLCAGAADFLREKGLKVFGPGMAAAKLEGSKSYSKEFMRKYGIPTAEAESFTEEAKALAYVHEKFSEGKKGLVIKADGLAAGKGVSVTLNENDALAAVKDCFSGAFGDAGQTVLIEECLFGEEASILALTDGKSIISLASSQDHKRLKDNDEGPNTGGMGAYSPAPVVTDELQKEINEKVLERFLEGVKTENLDYRGIIYAGIMVTGEGPKVLEFNVRFGDPETQAVLMRLESDLADVMLKTAESKVDEIKLEWLDGPAVCIVIASGGYPASYKKGYPIKGLEEAASTGAVVFHAGTTRKDGEFLNSGGRVLGVTASGSDIASAVKNAYNAVEKISWADCFYRKDIAARALTRTSSGL